MGAIPGIPSARIAPKQLLGRVVSKPGACSAPIRVSEARALYDPAMAADVLAAALVAPGQFELRRYPYPDQLEPGAVLIKMLASGICGTDKHTFRGETQQYAGTDHASSTPFPIIQGHENVGIVTAIGDGGATSFDGKPLSVGDRVVPAPNRACGECEFCRGDYPYYFCRRLENYGNSLTCAEAPYLFGGWAEFLYLRPGTPVFQVPDDLPTNVAVLTELFAVTHSLDLAAKMPRPGGFRRRRHGCGGGHRPGRHRPRRQGQPARRIDGDRHRPVRAARRRSPRELGATDTLVGQRRRPVGRVHSSAISPAGRGVDVVVDATGIRRASDRRSSCCATAAR